MSVSSIRMMDLAATGRTGLTASSAAVEGSFQQAMQQAAVAGASGLESMFAFASQSTGVPVNLLKAVAKAESDFNQDSVSHCGATGIMQLMPETARSVGVTDIHDPAQNILGGARYLRKMLDRYDGDTTLALAAYNAGPGAVDRYGGVPPYAETQNYVRKITASLGGAVTVPVTASVSAAASGGASAAEQLSAMLSGFITLLSQQDSLFPDSAGLFAEKLQDAAKAEFLTALLNDEDKEKDEYTF